MSRGADGAAVALGPLAEGVIFARDYRIVRPLADGGMGTVYIAEQISTSKQRALKVMHPKFAADSKGRDRFAQEARAGSRIESDHVVDVVAAGIDETTGTPWLAMELLRGELLCELIERRGAIPPGEMIEIFQQLGHALAAAHREGIVHRDLKPENIFLAVARRDGTPFTLKVLDFGIAKWVQESRGTAAATDAMGSPYWMSPEQTEQDGRIRPATDVWALGLLAFYALTGRYYWKIAHAENFSIAVLLREILFEDIARASVRAVEIGVSEPLPTGFDDWFARCLVRTASARFADAGEAVAALSTVLADAGKAPAPVGRSAALASAGGKSKKKKRSGADTGSKSAAVARGTAGSPKPEPPANAEPAVVNPHSSSPVSATVPVRRAMAIPSATDAAAAPVKSPAVVALPQVSTSAMTVEKPAAPARGFPPTDAPVTTTREDKSRTGIYALLGGLALIVLIGGISLAFKRERPNETTGAAPAVTTSGAAGVTSATAPAPPVVVPQEIAAADPSAAPSTTVEPELPVAAAGSHEPGRASNAPSHGSRGVRAATPVEIHGPRPSTEEVTAAVAAVAPRITRCGDGSRMTISVSFAFGRSGQVVRADTASLLPPAVRSCVLAFARTVTIPSFRSGGDIRVAQAFRLR